jgi:uncharacterized OsmC-like protein
MEQNMDSVGTVAAKSVNGIDVAGLGAVVREIAEDPAKGIIGFRVTSRWKGQTRSEATVESYSLGGHDLPRSFVIAADEPIELFGSNTAPNPQELLMSAFNACIMVGYVAGAAVRGISLEKVEIETSGELDLRGFLGLDERIKPGYEAMRTTVRIKGDGTPEQFAEIHETVRKTSPNWFNLSNPVAVEARLVVE